MKKLWDKVMEGMPIVWGLLWTGIITLGSVTILIATIKWLLKALGVL